MDKLYIVDGNSLAFRAFYGLPPLYSSQGIPCNAVFGFMKMLVGIITKYSPKYLVVSFDAGKHTFRHEIFAEYKGTRKPMPDELRTQLPIIKDILKQMHITTIEIADFEADDIIGTLSKKYDIEKVLVSADRDLLQLISPVCQVWLTQKGLTEIAEMDEIALKDKYGITPKQVIEMKSIMGDTSDNIPGVKGIGEKTASKLIAQYGDLDNIYANINNITGKVHNLLVENKQMAYISKQLATIKTDCEIDYKLEDFRYDFPFGDEVRQSFMGLEFKALQKDEYFKTEDIKVSLDFEHHEISGLNQQLDVLNNLLKSKCVAVNFDDVGLCIAEGDKEYQLLHFDLAHPQVFELVKQLLGTTSVEKIVFDVKSTMHQLREMGMEIKNYFDVSLAYYLLGELDISINSLLTKNGLSTNYVSVGLLKLKNIALPELERHALLSLYYDLELQLVPVLYSMEVSGIKVDAYTIKQLSQKYSDELKALTSEIYELAGEEFNINSPKQLMEVLFEKLKLQYKGKKSTSVDVLEAIQDQHPIIEKLIRYRKVAKICSTYLDGLLPFIKEGKIHTTFIQTATATGRLSSREPNLQNIPVRDDEGKELRKLFTSSFDGGVIVSADYSQIELRLLAHFSKDEHLIKSFNEGKDIHATTASRIFNVPLEQVNSKIRGMAKAVNFGIIYGISEYGLAKNVRITPKQAREFIAKYFELYPSIRQYMDNNVAVAKENGYASTMLGRIRYIPEITSSNYTLRQFGERVAMNMPLQGTASDIIKMAMINVQEGILKRNLKSRLILQIHDELIVDTHPNEIEIVSQILKQEMENVVKLLVPLTVDVNYGKSWFETK